MNKDMLDYIESTITGN